MQVMLVYAKGSRAAIDHLQLAHVHQQRNLILQCVLLAAS